MPLLNLRTEASFLYWTCRPRSNHGPVRSALQSGEGGGRGRPGATTRTPCVAMVEVPCQAASERGRNWGQTKGAAGEGRKEKLETDERSQRQPRPAAWELTDLLTRQSTTDLLAGRPQGGDQRSWDSEMGPRSGSAGPWEANGLAQAAVAGWGLEEASRLHSWTSCQEFASTFQARAARTGADARRERCRLGGRPLAMGSKQPCAELVPKRPGQPCAHPLGQGRAWCGAGLVHHNRMMKQSLAVGRPMASRAGAQRNAGQVAVCRSGPDGGSSRNGATMAVTPPGQSARK